MKTRYSFGGDEHIFAEIAEEMSLEAFFKSLSITRLIREKQIDGTIDGITEICPANASYQVKYNPDRIHPNALLQQLQELEHTATDAAQVLDTRIMEIPVFYQDPWTHETLMRFRERHQDPSGTDLDYAAKINGFDNAGQFIQAHHQSPWMVTMVGFVAGLPFMYQLVERERQLQVPKYLSPRTDTPKLTVGHGGCFGCIYSVRGAGGYQMFGVTPMPIYDPQQSVGHLQDFMVLFKPGDIVKFNPINHQQYDELVSQVEDGSFVPKIQPCRFSLAEFQQNISASNQQLIGALYEH